MKRKQIDKRVWILINVIIVVVIIVAGFQLHIKMIMKKELLKEDTVCSLPCWNNITPNETTREEAQLALLKIHYIKIKSIQEEGTDSLGKYSWLWVIPGRRTEPEVSWDYGVVKEINLGIPFSLSVEEVIEKYGPPEAIGIWEGGIPEKQYWVVDLFYPQKGIQLKAYPSDSSTIIEPSTKIGIIHLFMPSSLENRINDKYSKTNIANWIFESWRGYGDLMKLYEYKSDF